MSTGLSPVFHNLDNIFGKLAKKANVLVWTACTRSSTDRVPVFGTVDVGSIPAGCTKHGYVLCKTERDSASPGRANFQ